MASKYKDFSKIFKFNLLPPKSDAEIRQLEDRDNTILSSFLLIFFSVFIFFALTLLDFVAIAPVLQGNKLTLDRSNNDLLSYNNIKITNGELFVKSQALEPLLQRDIKLINLINISDKLVASFNNQVAVDTYKRETSGEFSLAMSVKDLGLVPSIVQRLKDQENVSATFIRRIGRDTANAALYKVIISFQIDNSTDV